MSATFKEAAEKAKLNCHLFRDRNQFTIPLTTSGPKHLVKKN
jgi:hypothetical protein